MNKYLNILIVSFFTCLSCKYDFGLAFFIPIAFFLIINDLKALYIVVVSSIASIFLFYEVYLIPLLVSLFLIVIYGLFFKKHHSLILEILYIMIVSFLSLIMASSNITFQELIRYLIYSLGSIIIYCYFYYNIIGYKYKSKLFHSYCYIEVVMAIISVIGATTLNYKGINLGLFVALYFSMYLSSSSYHLLSMFFSILSMLLLKTIFQMNESVLIPFISALYMLESLYSTIITICLAFVLWVFKTGFIDNLVLEILIFNSLFFEVFRFSLIGIKKNIEEVTKGVYEASLEKVNDEIVAFASFLDLLSKEYTTSKQYAKKLSQGIDELSRRYCDNCYLKNDCHKKNKQTLYNYFKDILLYGRDDTYNNQEILSFYKACPYIVDIKKSANLISDRLKMNEESARNNLVISQINGISNVLRQYIVDNSLKKEIAYEKFYQYKEALIDQGYNISVFNVRNTLKENLLIEIGIRNIDFLKCKSNLEEIGSFFLTENVTANYINNKKMTTFIHIIPKIMVNVDYGYGSLAAKGKTICGDNFLIKELEGSKLIAAISDGMGKGIEATNESSETLKLIDEITTSNLSSSTALQIINTFYYIQEYLEKYSTLDFIEIKRTMSEAILYKMGSSTTYIYHGDGTLEKIYNKNLPFGIEEIVEEVKIKLSHNDVIIMASDGVFENIINEEEFENYLKGVIQEEPQKITYEVLNYVRNTKVKDSDDMSVITLKIIAS